MRRRGVCGRASGRAWCRSDVRAAQQQSSLRLRTHPRGAGRTGRTARCGGAVLESSRDFLTPEPLIRLGGGLCLTYQQHATGRAKDGRARHFKNVTTRPRTAPLARGFQGETRERLFRFLSPLSSFASRCRRSPRTAASSGRRLPESASIAALKDRAARLRFGRAPPHYRGLPAVDRKSRHHRYALVPSLRFPPPCQRC